MKAKSKFKIFYDWKNESLNTKGSSFKLIQSILSEAHKKVLSQVVVGLTEGDVSVLISDVEYVATWKVFYTNYSYEN